VWEKMSIVIYQNSIEKLQHLTAIHLYSQNSRPRIYEIKDKFGLSCPNNHHVFKCSDKKFGEAFITIKVCKDCGYGISEVFPPKQEILK